jgi:hypothetical protein
MIDHMKLDSADRLAEAIRRVVLFLMPGGDKSYLMINILIIILTARGKNYD